MFKTILVVLALACSMPALSQAFESQEDRCSFEANAAGHARLAKIQGMSQDDFNAQIELVDASPDLTAEQKAAAIAAFKFGYAAPNKIPPQIVAAARYQMCMDGTNI